jgi:hypothetical protein
LEVTVNHKKRKPRTESELHVISNRLFYEWQMLISSAEALTAAGGNQLLKNAFIESCAIHARALIKFFFAYHDKNEPRTNDAIADDFFSDSSIWQAVTPSRPVDLEYEAFGIFADKQIAHMSYTAEIGEYAINKGHHQWNFTVIADAIQPYLEEFISLVPADKLGDRWKFGSMLKQDLDGTICNIL